MISRGFIIETDICILKESESFLNSTSEGLDPFSKRCHPTSFHTNPGSVKFQKSYERYKFFYVERC